MGAARVIQRAAVAAAASMTLVACSPSDDSTAGDGREAAIYEAVLTWLLDDESRPAAEPGDDERPGWTMFVASRHEEPIGVDVQALVVEALDDDIAIRFIDELTEAVDEGDERRPVREDGILVGLGAIPDDGDRVELYVDRYRNADDVTAWDVTVERRAEVWGVDGVPAVTDVRASAATD